MEQPHNQHLTTYQPEISPRDRINLNKLKTKRCLRLAQSRGIICELSKVSWIGWGWNGSGREGLTHRLHPRKAGQRTAAAAARHHKQAVHDDANNNMSLSSLIP